MSEQLIFDFSPASESFAEGGPVSPSASRVDAKPRLTSAGSGQRSRGRSKNKSPPSLSAKTCQGCCRPGCETCWSTLPASGSMQNGRLSALPASERPTDEGASLSLLPTPTASDYGSNQGGSAGRSGQRKRPSLKNILKAALLPTPTVSGDWNRRGASPTSGDGLSAVAGTSIRLREWMMGFPAGWAVAPAEPAEPSETPSLSRSPRRSGERWLVP